MLFIINDTISTRYKAYDWTFLDNINHCDIIDISDMVKNADGYQNSLILRILRRQTSLLYLKKDAEEEYEELEDKRRKRRRRKWRRRRRRKKRLKKKIMKNKEEEERIGKRGKRRRRSSRKKNKCEKKKNVAPSGTSERALFPSAIPPSINLLFPYVCNIYQQHWGISTCICIEYLTPANAIRSLNYVD